MNSARLALQNLLANKTRTGLTTLGMAIGTASIILVVTVALAGRDYILKQIEGVGSNLVYLYYETGGTVSGEKTLSDELTQGDLKAIQRIPGVAEAAGFVVDYDTLFLDGRERQVIILGTTPEYRQVRNLRILSGRFFDSSDERSFNKVCVLTPALARRLFGSLDVFGRTVKFFNVRFTVVGVFEEGVETFGTSEISQYTAIIPLTVLHNFNRTDKLDEIYASAHNRTVVPAVTVRIKQLLEMRHRSGPTYRVENLSEILRAADNVATALTAVLFLIGTISLVISGIGIMNIMLVTVTERTREIGIRRAVGARRREILRQFLVESVLMAIVGGIVGILLGISGPLASKAALQIEVPVSWVSIALAFALSFLAGVTFGLIPANRAARLNPIEALRYE